MSTSPPRQLLKAQETNAPKIVVALSVMTTLSLVFMSLRFYCKGRYHKRVGLDDWVIGGSWICLFVFAVLSIASTRFGIGQHINAIPFDDRIQGLKLLYIGRFFGIVALAVSKTSFGITLLHLAMVRWQRVLLWFIMVTINVVLGLTAVSLLVQCTPIDKAWDLAAKGTCWPSNLQVNIGIGASAYSAAMDFFLALFPTFLIWKLKMEWREKLGVILAMSLGVLAGITAGIKTSFIPGTSRSVDFTFTTTDLLIWSGAESAVTIIATSIPFLRLLVKEVAMRVRTPKLDVDYLDGSAGNTGRSISPLQVGGGAKTNLKGGKAGVRAMNISKPTALTRPGSDSDNASLGSNAEKRARVVFEGGRARVEFRDNWDNWG